MHDEREVVEVHGREVDNGLFNKTTTPALTQLQEPHVCRAERDDIMDADSRWKTVEYGLLLSQQF